MGATTIDAPTWGAVIPAGPELWRVRERRGRILGHVRIVAGAGEPPRYRAERFHAPTHGFRTLGEFSTARDAMDSLRV